MAYENDVLTRNDNDELAVRVVQSTEATNNSSYNDVLTYDTNGKLAVRVVGAGGGGGSVDYNRVVEKIADIPSATSSTVGKVYMYMGETNSTYTHGYIYECVATQTATAVAFSGSIVSSWDVADFVSYMQEGGSAYDEVTHGTLTYDASGNLWDLVGYDANGIEVLSFHEYTEDLEDFGCVFASETHQDGDSCQFTLTTEQSGKKWKRLDVQPNNGGGGGAVSSVNGKTGDVVLDAEDVGALPSDTPIPSTAKDVNAVPQLSELPTADASNVGNIVEYSGATIESVPSSATAEQTVGSGLSNILVNVETFESQINTEGTYDFTASDNAASMTFNVVSGNATMSCSDPTAYITWSEGTAPSYPGWDWHEGQFVWFDDGNPRWIIQERDGTGISNFTAQDLETYFGIVTTGTPQVDDKIEYTLTEAGVVWSYNSQTVDLTDYGITYTGTPSDGDVLEVEYTEPIVGITNGYFYQNQPTYSDPSATISQTAGSGLSNLAVNVDTFMTQINETGNYNFVAEVVPEGAALGEPQGTGVWTASLDFNQLEFAVNNTFGINDWENDVIFCSLECIDAINNSWRCNLNTYSQGVISDDASSSYWGLTIDSGTPVNGDYVDVEYHAGSTSWKYNNQDVDLNDYGITYTGTPVNNDVLTVAYNAPAVIGYQWNQKDVQPAGKGGGGIDWKTVVDVPANAENVNWYGAAPWYEVNMLPEGNYEFYWFTKCPTGMTYEGGTMGSVVVKVNFKLWKDDNNQLMVRGNGSFVLGGDYMPDTNRIPQERYIPNCVGKNGEKLVITGSEYVFSTNIYNFMSVGVEECFKLSAIKNIDTGEEYVATGRVRTLSDYYTEDINSAWMFLPLSPTISLPSKYWYGSDTVMDNQYLVFGNLYQARESNQGGNFSSVNIRLNCGSDEFWAKADNCFGYCVTTIYKATGVFANTKVGTPEQNLCVYLNFADNTSRTVWAGIGVCGSEPYVEPYGSFTKVLQFTEFPTLKIGATVTKENLGAILQYDGTTDANYTNGYFYKATGTKVSVPESFVTEDITPNDFSVSVNLSDFITAIENVYSWMADDIKTAMRNYPSYDLYYDADNGDVVSVNWYNMWYDMNDPSILACFTVSTTGSYSGQVQVSFTGVYTPAHTEIQNGHWEQIDVQPSSGGSTALSLTLPSANWVNNSITVTASGVTASNNVIVSPAPASQSAYTSSGVLCTAQSTDSLTFTCTQAPNVDLTVTALII